MSCICYGIKFDEMRLGIMSLISCILISRVAGTVGAIVTCPLEVVKTRLQSSSAFIYPPRVSENPTTISNAASEGMLRPEQRRQLCTTILRKRPQVHYFNILINKATLS